ncbi:MAG TPA: tRNA lysidine(34) synthetase TilS [Bacteroidales bacterium]|nr:tRNA lysidine(34) synthetase TilS [Bacteroidales bacterium]
MTEQFEKYRKENRIFTHKNSILVAVSGGIDSIVMLDLFKRGEYNIAVAHCNFQLRGDESDGDEKFVENICKREDIKLFKTKFKTAEYASKKGISIQMAARDLRFGWLAEIRKSENHDLVAIGHNLNDSVETMLINLTRGTGINGLTGMSPRSGYIIRPILFATRLMIQDYAADNNLQYREDSSNIQTKYTRNKIRHSVIPVLEQINPSVIYSIDETSDFLKSAYIIYKQSIETKIKEIIEYRGDIASVEISELKKLEPVETWIFEIFKHWNFGRQQIGDIIQLIGASTGKQLFSNSHIVTKDRSKMIISPLADNDNIVFTFESADELRQYRLIKQCEIIKADQLVIKNDPDFAYLDADRINYPLIIRKWQEGDYFHPLGMMGKKKVSDLLIDMKIPLPEKENIYILEIEGKIAWVIGLRIDDRFKVTKSTSKVILLQKR